MKRTGAQIIMTLLERQGIRILSGIPGGANLPLYDALGESSIQHVLAKHEQGAGFIAQGMSRASGRAAVCFGTSGPGATNLLTAIADAKLDSIPMVAITGQVPQSVIGTDAFQEVDTYGLTLPITKHNFFVRTAAELLKVIPEAFTLAESGRPGPVVVDVPKDVQMQSVEFDAWPEPGGATPVDAAGPADIARLAEMIHDAKRPILYIGGGIVASGASEEVIAFAHKNSIPVVLTLSALGTFPPGDPLYLGMLGMHGARYTNLVLEEADLLLAFGSRFGDRSTGRATEFCKHATIAHVDIDRSEIGKIKAANLGIAADVGEVLRALTPLVREDSRSDWNARVAELKAKHPFVWPANDDLLNPMNFIRTLGELCGPDTIVTTDVGQHQMWTAQAYPFRKPRTLQSSGGLGTMGFGLPAAIGAALEKPETPVICVSGDGSILMNIQEFATLAELDLNVKVFIMNNGYLGLVRQQQELFYGERYVASRFDMSPDFAAIARGFHLNACDFADGENPLETLRRILAEPGPCIVNVPVHFAENVMPMVPPGAANRDMLGGELTHA